MGDVGTVICREFFPQTVLYFFLSLPDNHSSSFFFFTGATARQTTYQRPPGENWKHTLEGSGKMGSDPLCVEKFGITHISLHTNPVSQQTTNITGAQLPGIILPGNLVRSDRATVS